MNRATALTSAARWRWMVLLAVLCALAIWFALADLGGGFLNQMLLYAPGLDKALHYGEYLLIFAILYPLGRLFIARPTVALAVAAGCALLLGGADELQQSFVATRNVEWADFSANVCGIALGVALFLRRARPLLAATTIVASVAGGVSITYASYSLTKDWARGQRYEQQQEFALAREHYLRALDAGMRTPGLFNSVSWVEIESGHGDAASAVRWAEEALALRPDDADFLDTYGWALHHAGRHREALATLERAYHIKPHMFCLNYHLAMVYEALGRRDEAEKRFRMQIQEFADASESRRAKAILDERYPSRALSRVVQ